MLSDQWSPYVGRFACDWHRLPGGRLSGNHRPGQEHPRIIATRRNAPSERSSSGQYSNLSGSGREQDARALRGGRSAGEDVVHQDHPSRCFPAGSKRPAQGTLALWALSPGLRSGLEDAFQQRTGPPARQPRQRSSERFGLVVPSRSAPALPQRNPGEDGGLPGCEDVRRRPSQRLEDPGGQPVRNGAKPAELELHQRLAPWPLVEEGGSRPGDGPWWAVRARRDPDLERPAASQAAGRPKDRGSRPAWPAERPRTPAAADAPPWEENVEDRPQHDGRVGRGTDMPTRPGPSRHGRVNCTGSESFPEPTLTPTARDRVERGTG
jgi:hypothetical protein